MRLGRGITAARRQASRLAGLVRLPVCCRVKTAIRRQASWLAKKASVILISRWPFALQKYSSHTEASYPARGACPPSTAGKRKAARSSALQNLPTALKLPNLQWVSLPATNCGEMQAFILLPCEIVNRQKTVHSARGKPARRQLRGSRAAIGSGGKKARPF